MSIDSEVSLGSVPMPLQRGASALVRYELRKWLAKKAVAPHAMKLKRTTPTDQPQQYGGTDQPAAPLAGVSADGAAAASAAASAAANAEAIAAAAALSAGPSSNDVYSDVASPAPLPLPEQWGRLPVSSDAISAAALMDDAPIGGNAVGADGLSRPSLPRPAVSDEDLHRAILAALMKHDNPRVGVGRAARGRIVGHNRASAWNR